MLQEDLGGYDTSQLQAAGAALQWAFELNPIVGGYNSGYTACTRKNAITHKEVSSADRFQAGAQFAAIVLPFTLGLPGKLIPNKLLPHEALFGQQIVDSFGGELIGNTTKNFPGIDGTLNGIKIALKETQGGLAAVLTKASEAEQKALNAGYSGVDVFIKAPNVGAQALVDFASKGPLVQIPSQGTVSVINVLTKDGWVTIFRL
jgi:hypothetical protein